MNTGLRDRVALVTGASGGIGAGVARAFASEGAKLILHYHTHRTAAEKLQRELSGAATMTIGADLREEQEVQALVRRVTATMALPQIARVEDVANATLFLASDNLARHMTGQTLVVAGGMEGRWLWQPEEIDPTIV